MANGSFNSSYDMGDFSKDTHLNSSDNGKGENEEKEGKEIFRCIKEKRLEELKELLKNKQFDKWDRTNELGYSMLEQAVVHKNTQLVQTLLDHGCCDVDKGLRLAVHLGYDEIIDLLLQNTNSSANETLLNHDIQINFPDVDETDGPIRVAKNEKYKLRSAPRDIPLLKRVSATPSPNLLINSIHEAAVKDDLIIMEKFQQRGMLTEMKKWLVLTLRVKNDECHDDPLREAEDRIQKCEIITSHAFLLFTNDVNSVVEAMSLSGEMHQFAYWYPAHKCKFDKLAEHCAAFPVKILEQCENEKEVRSLFMNPEEDGEYRCLQRAFECHQKEFIAHHNCQNVLYKMWLSTLYCNWQVWPVWRRSIYVAFQILLMPLICILWTFGCKTRTVKHYYNVPLNRFIYSSTSYGIFLFIIVFRIMNRSENQFLHRSIQTYDIVMLIWILGHAARLSLFLKLEHIFSNKMSWWMRCEVLMIFSFLLYWISLLISKVVPQYLQSHLEFADGSIMIAIATASYPVFQTIAIFRILQWFHLCRSLGYLIISFSRMLNQIYKLLFIFGIVLFAFSVGIFTLHDNYHVMREGDESETWVKRYGLTLRTLLWVLFGEANGEYIENQFAVSENSSNNTSISGNYWATSIVVGYIMWAIFNIIFIIILLNMMIAILNNSFQIVQDNFETEWKFARVRLWMYHFENCNFAPPPINLIEFLVRLIHKLWRKISRTCCRTCITSDVVDYGIRKRTCLDKNKKIIQGLLKKYRYHKDIEKQKTQNKNDINR